MNTLQSQAAEATSSAVASKVTYGGATVSAAGWLISSEFIAVGGFVLAVAGFVINLYFKIKEDRRQQALHAKQMQDLSSKAAAEMATEIEKALDARLSRIDLPSRPSQTVTTYERGAN